MSDEDNLDKAFKKHIAPHLAGYFWQERLFRWAVVVVVGLLLGAIAVQALDVDGHKARRPTTMRMQPQQDPPHLPFF